MPIDCRNFTSIRIPRARRSLRSCKLEHLQMPSPRRTITSQLIPRARWRLSSCPLQNFQVPSLRRLSTNLLTPPRARRVLRSQKLQNVQVPSLCRLTTSLPTPRARRVLCPGPHQNVQVPSRRRISTSPLIPSARRVLRSQKLQNVQVPSLCRTKTSPHTPRARRVLTPCKLQNFKVPSLRRLFTSPVIPRARRVQASQKLQSFQAPSLRHPITCHRIELVALSRKALQNLNAAAHPRPFACCPVQLPLLLLNQPPQDLDAALERRVVQQLALVHRSPYPLASSPPAREKTRQDLEGVADPLKPTQAVRRSLPAVLQLKEVVSVQDRFQLPTEDLRRVSEEPAGHREGEKVVLVQVLVEDLLTELGRQAPQELLVLGLQLGAHGAQGLRCTRALKDELLPPPHKRVLLLLLGPGGLRALRGRSLRLAAAHPVRSARLQWSGRSPLPPRPLYPVRCTPSRVPGAARGRFACLCSAALSQTLQPPVDDKKRLQFVQGNLNDSDEIQLIHHPSGAWITERQVGARSGPDAELS